jgi:uncharacterized protein YbjT (DUF2867 family)
MRPKPDQHAALPRRHPLRIMLNNVRRGMMDRKRDGEEHLRRSGVPYCIVRPGRFVDKPAGAAAKLKTGRLPAFLT